ncbi:MAG TPA: efflux RND transporter periplasmic adaptor subunit [Gemmatimonadales bacterium]|jgi:RND family efflux transporter MFP subunit
MRAALSVYLVALCGCGGSASGEGGSTTLADTRVPVGTATVVRDTIRDELVLTGRLGPKPGGSALLAAPAAGIVASVETQVGSRVRRGEELLLLDVPELAAESRQRDAAAAQAEREAERQARLFSDGVTSKRQVEEAAANAGQAASAAEAARALLARTRVRAPLGGRVQSVRVQQGERVDAGAPLAEVIDMDTLDLHVAVPANRLTRLRAGMPVTVVQEGDSTPHPARISAVAPGVDSLTNAGAIVVRVPNRGGRLLAGAGATARVLVAVEPQALLVPDSSLVLAGDSSAVFVVGPDSIAHQRIVTPGVRQGGRVAVEGPLSPGDRVVTTGAFGLQDGMRVSPR